MGRGDCGTAYGSCAKEGCGTVGIGGGMAVGED